jgi:hypothetical protein
MLLVKTPATSVQLDKGTIQTSQTNKQSKQIPLQSDHNPSLLRILA